MRAEGLSCTHQNHEHQNHELTRTMNSPEPCTHQNHEHQEPGQLHRSAIDSFAGQEGEADAVAAEEEEPGVVLHQPLLRNHLGTRGERISAPSEQGKLHKYLEQ